MDTERPERAEGCYNGILAVAALDILTDAPAGSRAGSASAASSGDAALGLLLAPFPPLPALPDASSHHSPVTSHALQAVKLIENVQSLILTDLTVKVDKAEQTALWEVLSCFPSRSLTASSLDLHRGQHLPVYPMAPKTEFQPRKCS